MVVGLGLEIQEDHLNDYLKNPQLRLVKAYTDGGKSGSTLNRPALQELLTDANQKLFSKVIVAKLDRLARDLYVQLFIEKELLVHGIEVISLAESFSGKDPIITAMRQIVGVFAQLERARITERLKDGRLKKLDSGGYAGGCPPYGYAVKNSKLVIEPKEAEVVKKIFELRKKRFTFAAIAVVLNNDGLKPRRASIFYPCSVHYIYKNVVYRGKAKYGIQRAGLHEALYPTATVKQPASDNPHP